MKLGSGIKGGVGSFLVRRSRDFTSIRQRHQTGPQFFKRKTFPAFQKGCKWHQVHRRGDTPQLIRASPTRQPEWQRFTTAVGDVRTRPAADFSFGVEERESGKSMDPFHRKVSKAGRADNALYAWQKQGHLQLFMMDKTNNGKSKDVFVCFHCGYPVRSALVAVVRDNWDYRMCYRCYISARRHGLERQL